MLITISILITFSLITIIALSTLLLEPTNPTNKRYLKALFFKGVRTSGMTGNLQSGYFKQSITFGFDISGQKYRLFSISSPWMSHKYNKYQLSFKPFILNICSYYKVEYKKGSFIDVICLGPLKFGKGMESKYKIKVFLAEPPKTAKSQLKISFRFSSLFIHIPITPMINFKETTKQKFANIGIF
jgi:hypothetical protein